MVDIKPFCGLRYAEGFAGPAVCAPPYDVISPAQRAALLAQDAHNIVHLDLGPTPLDPAWYAAAAQTLGDWLAQGVLRRDATPAFYGYQQQFVWNGQPYTRTGFMARVRLMPWGQGIHRHELTRNQPKADRLQLMRALNMQTSPVFGLYADPTGASSALVQASIPAEALAIDTADGGQHRLWRVDDPATILALQHALRATDVVIADGHHRYETALALAAERQARQGPSPTDDVLMHLTPLDDPGLLVLATHRVITACALPVESLLQALASWYSVASVSGSLTDAIRGLRGAFGLRVAGRSLVLRPLSPVDPQRLDVVALQETILEPVLGISPGQLADADLIRYTIDEQEACQLVDSGRAALALILNPTPLEAIWATALRGDVMPQKSTFFHPKLLTGLVLNPLWE